MQTGLGRDMCVREGGEAGADGGGGPVEEPVGAVGATTRKDEDEM